MKMNLIYKTALAGALGVTNFTYASGIPVVDGASIAQNLTNHIENIAKMAEQLSTAQSQLMQMKQQYEAIYGIKGFTDILQNGGINTDLVNDFKGVLNTSNTDDLLAKAKQYFSDLPDCSGVKDKNLCTNAALSGVSKLNFADTLQKQIDDKINKISSLSRRAQTAKDPKSMQELQANIALQQSSLAALKLQQSNFGQVQQAQQEIADKQQREVAASNEWNALNKAKQGTSAKSVTFDDLLK